MLSGMTLGNLTMKIFWKFYAFLFYFIVLSNAYQLLGKDALLSVYYNTAIVFSHWYIVPYFLNILNVLIACAVSFYIFGYAFDIEAISKAPIWLFYIRLLSELTGHSYEIKMLQAQFSHGNIWGYIILASLIFPIIPSFIAQWRMCFNKK